MPDEQCHEEFMPDRRPLSLHLPDLSSSRSARLKLNFGNMQLRRHTCMGVWKQHTAKEAHGMHGGVVVVCS